ncbi:retroviral-like aspartic protease family protein [Patescibacteria group bacterium]|nr:retroviral-like aspartic protease family protein [Patescibacteria group bacterium]
MFNSFIFPHGITLKEDGVIDTIPVAEVAFRDKKGEWLSLFLIIDSGATISALPKSDAVVLGIDVKNGKHIVISGIGNEKLSAWQHNIPVRLKNAIIQLPVVFLDKEVAPRILGRGGIFERFTLVFEESQKRTAFIGESGKEAKLIQKILNKIQQ